MTKRKGLLKLLLLGFSFIFLFTLASCDDSKCKEAHAKNGTYFVVTTNDGTSRTNHNEFYQLDFANGFWYDDKYNEGKLKIEGDVVTLYGADDEVVNTGKWSKDGDVQMFTIDGITNAKWVTDPGYIPKTFKVLYQSSGATIAYDWVTCGGRVRTIKEITGANPYKANTATATYTFVGYKWTSNGATYEELPDRLSTYYVNGQAESDGVLFYVEVVFAATLETRGIKYVPVAPEKEEDPVSEYSCNGYTGYAISAPIDSNDPLHGEQFSTDKVISLNLSQYCNVYTSVKPEEDAENQTIEYDPDETYYLKKDDKLYFNKVVSEDEDGNKVEEKVVNEPQYTVVNFEVEQLDAAAEFDENEGYFIEKKVGDKTTYVLQDAKIGNFEKLKSNDTLYTVRLKVQVGSGDSFKKLLDDDEAKATYGLYVVKEGNRYEITKVASGAFNNIGKCTSISIPNSYKEIGSKAFANFYSLESIMIPKEPTSIAADAFAGSLHKVQSIFFNGTKEDYEKSEWVNFDFKHDIVTNKDAKYTVGCKYGYMEDGEFVVDSSITNNKKLADAVAKALDKEKNPTAKDVYVEKENINIFFQSTIAPDYYYYREFIRYDHVGDAEFDANEKYYTYDFDTQVYTLASVDASSFATQKSDLYVATTVSEADMGDLYDKVTKSEENPNYGTGKLILTEKEGDKERLAYVLQYTDETVYEKYYKLIAGFVYVKGTTYYAKTASGYQVVTFTEPDFTGMSEDEKKVAQKEFDDMFAAQVVSGLYTMTLVPSSKISGVDAELLVAVKDTNGNPVKVPKFVRDENKYWYQNIGEMKAYSVETIDWWQWHGNKVDGGSTRLRDIALMIDDE